MDSILQMLSGGASLTVTMMTHISSLGSLARKARLVLGSALLSVVGLAVVAAPASAQQTPSQTNTNELNQLLNSDVFSTTANHNAAGEAWVNGEFRFLKFPGSVKQYLFEVKGAYAITDQITVGGWVPIYNAKIGTSHTGLGDITFFGQYKLDQLVNPDIVNLSAQLDVFLPTGSRNKLRDTGHFGVRPNFQAFKNFGLLGPGSVGAYAVFGFTLTTNPDVRIGVAGTYEWMNIVGILEFDTIAGDKHGRPTVTLTPGVAYRGLRPFEFAAGIPLGLNDGSPDWGVVLKATWALQK